MNGQKTKVSLKNIQQKIQKHILIVDDSVDNQQLLTILFESIGYKVDNVSNGAEALSLLSNCRILPDLILLDYQMPVMSGLEFRQQQLQNKLIQNIPVIVMTGEINNNLHFEMKNPFCVTIKPLQVNDLIKIVSEALN